MLRKRDGSVKAIWLPISQECDPSRAAMAAGNVPLSPPIAVSESVPWSTARDYCFESPIGAVWGTSCVA